MWSNRTVTGGIVFLILFSPLAFGSVHPWAFSLMEATLFLLVMVWMATLMIAGSRVHGARGGDDEAKRKEQRVTAWSTEQGPPQSVGGSASGRSVEQSAEVRSQRSEVREWLHAPSSMLPAPSSLRVAKELGVPLALFFGLVLFQILPIPPALLRALSPSTFELYTQTLSGWPSEAPYAELAQGAVGREQGAKSKAQRAKRSGQGAWSMERGAGNVEQSAIRNPQSASGSKLHAPGSMLDASHGSMLAEPKTQQPTPVILPTLDEVRAGVPVPFEEQTSEAGSQRSEVSSQSAIRNSQSAIPPSPSGSLLHAPRSLLPETWLPLSLAPSLSKTDLLKFAAYAALFFLVLLYPFAEARGQEAGGARRAEINSQSEFRNSQSEMRKWRFPTSGSMLHASGSTLVAPSSLLPAPCSMLLYVVIFSGLLIAVIGFVQHFTWNGMILWFFVPYDWGSPAPGNDPRASGPFINPDHFANYLALIFPLAVGTAIHSRYLFRKEIAGAMRIFAGLAAFLIFTGILLSLSRSGWIAMLLGVSLLLWLSPGEQRAKRKAQSANDGGQSAIRNSGSMLHAPSSMLGRARLSLILLSVLLIISLFFVGPRGREQVDIRIGATVMEDAGLWGRTSIWSDTFKMIREFPVMGVGLGSWQDLFQRYQSPPWGGAFYREAHNDYLELLAETGLIGLGLLAWFFWLGGKKLWSHLQSSADVRSKAFVAMLLAALGVMAFHEFFDFSLQIPANAFLFTLLFAIALRVATVGEGQRAKGQAQSAEAGENPQFAIRSPQFGARFPAPCSLLLAVILFFAALRQEMTPYPYNLTMPRSVAEAREMILAHPALPTPHLYLLRLLQKQAPLEWETKELKAALWLDPTNPHPRDVYAGALLMAGKKEEGLREISRSVVNAPSFSDHAYLNGRFFPWLSADEKNAVEHGFKEALALDYPGAMDGLASFYERTGRFADQGRLFEQAAAQTKDVAAVADLAVKAAHGYLKAGDPKRAETLLQKAISITPDDPRSYHALAILIYAPQKEIERINKIISEGIKNGAPSFELHLALAEAMKGAGEAKRIEAALKMAEEALQSEAARNGKEPYGLYISLADTAQRLGFRDKAKAALAGALDLYPSSPEVLNRLAQLHLQDRDFGRAAYYFRSIINVNPAASDAYYHLAVAEEAQYRFAAAGEAYTRAIELAPENGGYRERFRAFKAKVEENQTKTSREQGAIDKRGE